MDDCVGWRYLHNCDNDISKECVCYLDCTAYRFDIWKLKALLKQKLEIYFRNIHKKESKGTFNKEQNVIVVDCEKKKKKIEGEYNQMALLQTRWPRRLAWVITISNWYFYEDDILTGFRTELSKTTCSTWCE